MCLMLNYYDKFQQYWAQFSDSINLRSMQSESLFSILFHFYVGNYYHTHQHIIECLELFNEIKHQLEDPVAVELAIWFHDIIYDPQASDNEEQSAKLMQKHCVGILKKTELEKVARWIIATKKHLPTKEHDLKYLLDIDLAILGSSTQRFAEYEQQIQKEYDWVETQQYQMKRKEVLTHFYHMTPLYQTAYFQEKLELSAKNNLMNSIKNDIGL